MELKIVYGKNGDGKTVYTDEQSKKDNTFVFNSEMTKWYDQETGIFSEKIYLQKIYKKKIKELEKSILSSKSKVFSEYTKTMNITNIKTVLGNNDFKKWEKWIEYADKHEHIGEAELNGSSILAKSDANIDYLANMKQNAKVMLENIILFKQLKDIKIEWKNQSENIPFKELLRKFIDDMAANLDDKVEKLGSYTYEELIFAIENNIDKTSDVGPFLKQLIIYSDDFQEIKRLDRKLKSVDEKSFKFSKDIKKYKVSEDLTEVNIGEGSKGEITARALEVFAKSVEGMSND